MLVAGDVRYEIVDFDGCIRWQQAGNGVWFVDYRYLPQFLKQAA